MPHLKNTIHTSKSPRPKCHRLLLGVSAFAVLCLFIFVFRGWIRVTVIPKVMTVFYANGVERSLSVQSKLLHDPFVTLGYAKVVKKSAKCDLQQAQSFHTELDCAASQQAYTKLPSSPIEIANVQKQARSLETLLKTNGWQAGSNGVTLTSLIDGTAQGKDYSPDAFYEKVIGNTDCVFDTMIAYSNPQLPAINSTLSCDRTINILGAPKNEFYTSSKGHF